MFTHTKEEFREVARETKQIKDVINEIENKIWESIEEGSTIVEVNFGNKPEGFVNTIEVMLKENKFDYRSETYSAAGESSHVIWIYI